ncbi:zinc finger MYM-type protein 1, partial [Tanacetum coccineum]
LWMYPFERYMKKLKGYVRNKAKPEDDDIIGDEDTLPHDLADSDVEDLINVNDDGVEKVYFSEEED